MIRPKIATVSIKWMDENEEHHEVEFHEDDLESAETLLGLMTGNITEEDLKP